MNKFLKVLAMVCSLILLPSCARVVVQIPPTGIVRVGPNVYGDGYYLTNHQWIYFKGPVKYPEGWYATDYHGK